MVPLYVRSGPLAVSHDDCDGDVCRSSADIRISELLTSDRSVNAVGDSQFCTRGIIQSSTNQFNFNFNF